MSFIKSLIFGRHLAKPKLYPTDEVQPVHMFDNTDILAGYDLFWTFPFREILNADVLGQSLSEVIESGEWRRLGGRFRRNTAGQFEIHIPTPFTAGRPPLYFTKEHFDQDMADHTIASRMPVAAEEAKLYPSSRELVALAYGPGAPRSMADRLASDCPQLALHVVTFRNGTVISITWNHVTCDLGGFVAILKAWVAHLHSQSFPMLMGKDDAMRHLYESPPEDVPHLFGDTVLAGWRKAVWIAQVLWDQWWTLSAFTSQQVCIPKDQMDNLMKRCQQEAAETCAGTDGSVFISEGDVIMALGMRAAAKSLPKGTRRSVTTLTATDARNRFPEIYDEKGAYIQNMILAATLLRPVSDILNTRLGALALKFRESLRAQIAKPQMRKTAALVYDAIRTSRSLPISGDATTSLLITANWSKAQMLRILDLGPAVMSTTQNPSLRVTEKAALPFAFYSIPNAQPSLRTSVINIRGRDHNGDMWLEGELASAGWEDMVAQVNI